MGIHEAIGKSDEWYTPKYIFESMECEFDLDVAHPKNKTNVPAKAWISEDSLKASWDGFIWMNPPFGGRNGIVPWLEKFYTHRNGIALTPDRTSTKWWQDAFRESDAVLFVYGKIKFIDKNGNIGKSPANGTTLFAIGEYGVNALIKAKDKGLGELILK